MDPARTAILLAPVGLASVPAPKDVAGAVPWGTDVYALRSLLGKTFSVPITNHQLSDTKVADALAEGIELAGRGHQCVVFKPGVAILQLQVLGDPRQLLRRWSETQERTLPERLLQLANSVLPGRVAKERGYVDWMYWIVDTEDYIDVRHPDSAVQRDAKAKPDWTPPEPIELGTKRGTRMWVDWSAAQVARLHSGDVELPTARLIEVFVVRCASWHLLTTCGLRAVNALGRPGDPTTSQASELRDLQTFGSQLVISYHTSLWTNDQYLVRIFDAIDAAWNANRELTKTRDVLERVEAVLTTRHDEELKIRDRWLGRIALALATLSLVSAIADSLNIAKEAEASGPTLGTILAFAVPFALLAIAFGLVSLVGGRKEPK